MSKKKEKELKAVLEVPVEIKAEPIVISGEVIHKTFEATTEALAATKGTISALSTVPPRLFERYNLATLPEKLNNLEQQLEILKNKMEPFTKLPPEKIEEYWATRDLVKRIENVEEHVDTRLNDFDKRIKEGFSRFPVLMVILAIVAAIASNIDRIIKTLLMFRA